MKTWRLFVAIPLPKSLVNTILQFQTKNAHLQRYDLRWVPPQNLHITLFFLGNVAIEDIGVVTKAIQKKLITTKPFEVEFEKFCFRSPRMIWLQSKENRVFTKLSHGISETMKNFLPTNYSAYKEPIPHITIARMKHFPRNKKFEPVPIPKLKILVTHAELWQSEPAQPTTRYISLEKFPLKKI